MANYTIMDLAKIFFFLLFPGFIFYNFFVAIGILPVLSGGYYGISSLLIALIYLLVLPILGVGCEKKNALFLLLFFLFVIYVFFVTNVHWFFNFEVDSGYAIWQSFYLIVFWISLFFVGRYLSFSKKKFPAILSGSILIIFLYFLYFFFQTGQMMFRFEAISSADSDLASYQGTARSVFVTILFLVSFYKRHLTKIFFIGLGVALLFFSGARSEFFVFLFVSILYLFFISMADPKKIILFFALILAIFIIFLFIANTFSESRHLQIANLAESSSWIARKEFQEVAIEKIQEYYIFGDFGKDVVDGKSGAYSHDILSSWVSYGLLGFLMYSNLILWSFLGSAYMCFSKKEFNGVFGFSFLINFSCLILAIIAKAVFWPLPALGWGLYVNAISIKDE